MFTDYTTSQTALLIEVVELLSRELLRPVSSKDLLQRRKQKPEQRPFLAQRVGQFLLKASRPSGNNTVLFQIGVIGNSAFYAAGQHPKWVKAFHCHEIVLRAQIHAGWAVPEHAVFLLGTEHDSLAKNALAGLVAEWAPVAEDRSVLLPKRIHDLLETAHKESPEWFEGKCPELVSREEAQSILVEEMAVRNLFFDGTTSPHRYLSLLRWGRTLKQRPF